MAKSLKDSFKDLFSKQWAISKVKCLNCGNTWTAIYPKIKNGDKKLECPKCKKRNSKIIEK